MQLGRADVAGIRQVRPRRVRGLDVVDAQRCCRRHRDTLADQYSHRPGNARDGDNSKNANCLASKQWSLLV